ncbi:hypothetical protein JCM6882_005636 [Rhodosporidiobolus microsporus]
MSPVVAPLPASHSTPSLFTNPAAAAAALATPPSSSLGSLLNKTNPSQPAWTVPRSVGVASPAASFTADGRAAAPAAAVRAPPPPPLDLVASGLSAPSAAADHPMSAAAAVASSPATAAFPPQHHHLQQFAAPYNRDFPPPLAPRHWTVLKEVGDGSFGTVWLADWHSPLNLPPGTQPPGPSSRPEYKGKQLVAIKRMKKAFEGGWDECMKLKELKSLRQIPMHPNIIPLYDAFLLPSSRELYFVFECMEGNLYQLTKSRKGRPLASGLTASIFYQIVAGLHHIHSHGYFHRDLKPENLLITTTGLADYPASALYALPGTPPEKDVVVVVKLADFGLAREITSKPPYTEYVSTRWYRAPEVLLRSRDYSVPVDMWALGTILVEVLTLKPLFPGDSEVDQVYKICEVLGDPSTDYGVDERGRQRGGGTWARGVRMAKDVGFAFPKIPPRNFAALFDSNTVPTQLIDCIADLLRYEPKARLNTQQCLEHAYFREVAYRFTPYAPPQTHQQHQQLPTPAPSHGSAPSPYGSSMSVNTAGLAHAPSQASPRSIPPSHSHSAQPPSAFNLPYPADPNAQALPSPDHFSRQQPQHAVPRPFSIASAASSGFQVPVQASGAAAASTAAGMDTQQQQSQQPPPILGFSSPAPSSNGGAWPATNGGRDASSSGGWGQLPNGAASGGLRPLPAGFAPSRRPSLAPSVAPSTYYDGSVYEGVAASSRAASIMSFPAVYGDPVASTSSAAPPPSLRSPSLAFPNLSPQQSRVDSIASGHFSAPGPSGLGFPMPGQSGSPSDDLTSTSPQSNRSGGGGRWGLGGHNPLKRSPSNASIAASAAPSGSGTGGSPPAPSALPAGMDPKKAKKEAERLAKEQEKASRLAKEQAARERARAVMKKKNQLMEAADPLHNFAAQSRGGGAAGAAGAGPPGAAGGVGGPTALEKGKGRALPSDRMVQQRMPQIIEDTSRLHVSSSLGGGAGGSSGASVFGGGGGGSFLANRFKARRRDDDDDVHSVSSNETGHSSLAGGGGGGAQAWPFPVGSGRGRTFSISSKATSASDPEQRRHRAGDFPFPVTEMDPLARVSSISSMPAPSISGGRLGSVGGGGGGAGGSLHRFPSYGHYTAPSTGHSSLDSRFIGDMAGLATTSTSDLPHLSAAAAASHHPHPHIHRSDSHSRPRLASPHHERYSPYTLPSSHGPRSPGPILPPISSFDQAQQQHLGATTPGGGGGRRGSTAAASIASFHSQPGTMPSYFGQQAGHHPDGVSPPGGSGGGGVYALPSISAMDTDPPPPSAPAAPVPPFFPQHQQQQHVVSGELASPVSATFPYPSPSLSQTEQAQQLYGGVGQQRAPSVPHHMATG